MAKKHMKKCSASQAIKEMQIKTMLRFSLLLEWLSSRTQTTTNVGKDMGKNKSSYTIEECKLVQSLWKIVWRFLKKIKNRTAI
jgi:hypothetical protein